MREATERRHVILRALTSYISRNIRITEHTRGTSLVSIRKLCVAKRNVVKITRTVCISFKRCLLPNDKAFSLRARFLFSQRLILHFLFSLRRTGFPPKILCLMPDLCSGLTTLMLFMDTVAL